MSMHFDWIDGARRKLDQQVDCAVGMPSDSYVSEEFFDQEKATVFSDRWCSIGFASDIPEPGDLKPIDFVGHSLFMARAADGSIRVFHNFCTHRGTQLVPSPCNKKLIVCPYHAWSFELNGALRKAPHHPNCDKGEFGLREVRSSVWSDVVFVNLSGRGPALEEAMRPLLRRWSEHDFGILRPGGSMLYQFVANWKLIVENFLECYHVPTVHPRLAQYSRFSDRYPIIFDEEFIGQGSCVYRPDVVQEELPRWSGVEGDNAFQAEYVMFFPNTLIGRMPDHVFIWTLNPLSPHHCDEHLMFYFIGDEAMQERFAADRAATLARWKEVNDEDFDIVQRLHAGTRSEQFPGARFAPSHEETIHQFHQLAIRETI